MTGVRLGLIGDNIASSRAPQLHALAGRLAGLAVSYERLTPRDLGLDFAQTFERCAASGFRGVNVTYPYKEPAAARVAIPDPLVRAIGAVNTVVFERSGPVGHNTDHSGFIAAYRATFGAGRPPGRVCMIGGGGVGKAVGFGLIALGAEELRIVERDLPKAEALAAAIRAAAPGMAVSVGGDAVAAARGAEGLINCTPVGMVGYPGSPLPAAAMAGARWAFDAVYTPAETRFLRDAQAAGAVVLSGYELFFFQGLHAFEIFCGRRLPEAALREALLAQPA